MYGDTEEEVTPNIHRLFVHLISYFLLFLLWLTVHHPNFYAYRREIAILGEVIVNHRS